MGQLRGKPRAHSARRSAAVSSGISVPAIEPAIASSGELRAAAGPSASTLSSRESSVARSGGSLARDERLAAPEAGEGKQRAPT